MPLGIFPGLLAGAGQGLVEQQKLRQQQQEAAIRNLLLQRSLRQDAEKQRADEALTGAPPLILPPAPVGSTPTPGGTPLGGGSGSSMPPPMSLFGGGDQGSAARAVDRGWGTLPTQASAPQLSPNTTNFFETSGPGYPINQTQFGVAPPGSKFPGQWDSMRQAGAPTSTSAQFGAGAGGGQGPQYASGAGDDSSAAVTGLFRPPTATDPALPTRDPEVAARTLPVSQASMQETGGGPAAAPAAGYRPPGPFGAMAPSAMGGVPGATPAAFTPGGAGAPPSLTDLSSLATPEVNKEVQETYPKLAQADNRQAYAETVFGAITKYVEDNCRGCDARSKAILRDRLIKERGDPAIKQYNETYKEQVLERFRIEQQQRGFEQQEKMKRESERIAREHTARTQEATDVRQRRTQELQHWNIYREDATGKQFEYNPALGKGREIGTGAPYTPQGSFKPISAAEHEPQRELFRNTVTGEEKYFPKSADIPKGWQRASERGPTELDKDQLQEIARRDRAFIKNNPDADDDAKAEAHWKNRLDVLGGVAQAKKAPAAAALTDTQARFWAGVIKNGGSLPPGLRRSGVVEQVMKLVGEDPNTDPGEFISKHSEVKANTTSLTNLQKQADAAISFEKLASRNFDIALKLAEDAVPTDLGPFFNRWIEEGDAMLGRPEVPRYAAAIITGANEYAKVMSGSTGTAASTVDSRREARELFSQYLSLPQISQVISVAKADMQNRENTYADQIAAIKARLSGKPAPADSPSVQPKLPGKGEQTTTAPQTTPAPGGGAQAAPPVPPSLSGKQLRGWSPSQQRFYDTEGNAYDKNGNPVR